MEKENAAPTFKRGFWFHPLCAFGDHCPDGTGEPLAILLRPGNAGSNTATDHITVVSDPTQERNSASPISTGTGSPRSRRTPDEANSPTLNYATAEEPAAKTGSGSAKTPA